MTGCGAASTTAPAPANQPDAATYWHLGPGNATAVSVWRRILTPTTEGDKRRIDGRGGVEISPDDFTGKDLDKNLLFTSSPNE